VGRAWTAGPAGVCLRARRVLCGRLFRHRQYERKVSTKALLKTLRPIDDMMGAW